MEPTRRRLSPRNDGRSDFHALLTKRGGAQATLVTFDLLRLNGDESALAPDRRAAGGLAEQDSVDAADETQERFYLRIDASRGEIFTFRESEQGHSDRSSTAAMGSTVIRQH
jgi:hypothetical protein